MNTKAPFQPQDLADLDSRLLDRAVAVVSMRDIHHGQRWERVIGLRHDVDNVIEPAVAFARWEAERGYRASYYIRHTASYWGNKTVLRKSLEAIAEDGHEIGIHNDAVAAAVLLGGDPREILAEAVYELRGYGFDVTGTVGHGNQACYDQAGNIRFINDELFVECARPQYGPADREIVAGVRLQPISLGSLGLEYDAAWLRRGVYLSDSGGVWQGDGFDAVADGFPYPGQLHVLIHADWWQQAFVAQELAA